MIVREVFCDLIGQNKSFWPITADKNTSNNNGMFFFIIIFYNITGEEKTYRTSAKSLHFFLYRKTIQEMKFFSFISSKYLLSIAAPLFEQEYKIVYKT